MSRRRRNTGISAYSPCATEPDVTQLAPSEILSDKDYLDAEIGQYVQDGRVVALSRTAPSEGLANLGLCIGMWKIDSFMGIYGREITQLSTMFVDALIPSEDSLDRMDDVERYAGLTTAAQESKK